MTSPESLDAWEPKRRPAAGFDPLGGILHAWDPLDTCPSNRKVDRRPFQQGCRLLSADRLPGRPKKDTGMARFGPDFGCDSQVSGAPRGLDHHLGVGLSQIACTTCAIPFLHLGRAPSTSTQEAAIPFIIFLWAYSCA